MTLATRSPFRACRSPAHRSAFFSSCVPRDEDSWGRIAAGCRRPRWCLARSITRRPLTGQSMRSVADACRRIKAGVPPPRNTVHLLSPNKNFHVCKICCCGPASSHPITMRPKFPNGTGFQRLRVVAQTSMPSSATEGLYTPMGCLGSSHVRSV